MCITVFSSYEKVWMLKIHVSETLFKVILSLGLLEVMFSVTVLCSSLS